MRRILSSASIWLGLGGGAPGLSGQRAARRPASWPPRASCSTASRRRQRRRGARQRARGADRRRSRERLREQKLELPPQNVLRQQVLERLVLQEIQMQRANHAGIKVPDETLNQRSAGRRPAQQHPARRSCRRRWRSRASTTPPTARTCARSSRCGLLRQRDVLQRISITPARDRPVPRQAGQDARRRAQRIQRLAHPDRRAGQDGHARRSSTQAGKRAQDVYERAKGGEDFAKLARGLLQQPDRARRRRARLAQGQRAADLPHRRDRAGSSPARSASRCARRPATTSSSSTRCAAQTAKAIEDQVHVRHILMKTNELADDATVRQKLDGAARAHPQGRGLRRPRAGRTRRIRARPSRAATSAGRAPAPSCRSSSRPSPS